MPNEQETPAVHKVLSLSLKTTSWTQFFYKPWAETLPLIHNMDEFWRILPPFLSLAGAPGLSHFPLLLGKLFRIGASQAPNDAHWDHIYVAYLLPATSLGGPNVMLGSNIWNFLKNRELEDRFTMYGEWMRSFEHFSSDGKKRAGQVTSDVKALMRRLSVDNVKTQGRALNKLIYTNPLVVLNVTLEHVQMYDSFIMLIPEMLKYVTEMGYDVLNYLIVATLANESKDRVKKGAGFAPWLQCKH